jgi:hypothetical protein
MLRRRVEKLAALLRLALALLRTSSRGIVGHPLLSEPRWNHPRPRSVSAFSHRFYLLWPLRRVAFDVWLLSRLVTSLQPGRPRDRQVRRRCEDHSRRDGALLGMAV